jgi:hypothetical protein
VFVAKAIERIGDHAKNIAEPSSRSSRAPTCATHQPVEIRAKVALSERAAHDAVDPGRRGRAGDPGAPRVNLRTCGYEVRVAATPRRRSALDRVLPDLVLLDWMLPGSPASRFARAARRHRARASCRSSC